MSVREDVSLTGQDRDFYLILGQSGCGKTTFLRMLGGFETPDRGEIRMDGKPAKKPGADRMMVFQSFDQLFPWYTLKENLLYAMRRAGDHSVDRERQADKFLKLAGLEGFENSYPHQLSGGMKQRGALARALCLEPKVLLLDEPFSSLDAITRRKLGQVLKEMTEETGCTAVMVTHDLSEALELGTAFAVFGKEEKGLKAEYRRDAEDPEDFRRRIRESLELHLE